MVVFFVVGVLVRLLEAPAPFIWVGQEYVTGAVVWSKDNVQHTIDSDNSIPFVALGLPISLNTADADVLASISGLGRIKSEAIVRYRGKHGCFRRIDDLEQVRGVGPKTVLKVAPYLRIDAFGPETCESPLPG